jgi:acyl-CoA reductase-like NAD-dependent aldehyde dehydrogenase
LTHHGQICFGTERFIVHEKVKDEFTRHLVQLLTDKPSAGHAVTVDGAKRAHSILEEAVADGAEFVVGSAEFTGSASLKASVLTNINPKSRINREESFAPSASLFVVKDDDEAIEVANETPFGLSASIFTGNYERALRLARELDFGQVQINSMTIHNNRKCSTCHSGLVDHS